MNKLIDPIRTPDGPIFKTLIRGTYLDWEGIEQHIVVQFTQGVASLFQSQEVHLRAAVAAVIASRGGELLSLQLVVENAEPIEVRDILGEALAELRAEQGAEGRVVPIRPRVFGK